MSQKELFEPNKSFRFNMHIHDSGRNKGNISFNDTLITIYLRLYGVDDMVNDYSGSEKKPASASTRVTLSN